MLGCVREIERELGCVREIGRESTLTFTFKSEKFIIIIFLVFLDNKHHGKFLVKTVISFTYTLFVLNVPRISWAFNSLKKALVWKIVDFILHTDLCTVKAIIEHFLPTYCTFLGDKFSPFSFPFCSFRPIHFRSQKVRTQVLNLDRKISNLYDFLRMHVLLHLN